MASPQRPATVDESADTAVATVLLMQLLHRADIEMCFCLSHDLARWDRAARTLHVNATATPAQKQAAVADLWHRLTSPRPERHLHIVGS